MLQIILENDANMKIMNDTNHDRQNVFHNLLRSIEFREWWLYRLVKYAMRLSNVLLMTSTVMIIQVHPTNICLLLGMELGRLNKMSVKVAQRRLKKYYFKNVIY